MSKEYSSLQETFDAAVQENIEEFGMDADEAVESAIKEFELQVITLCDCCAPTARCWLHCLC
jgi:hypothetical protein